MLFILIKSIYIFLMAIVLAILEVQIEGKHGWATNLPTWRPGDDKWYAKFYKKIMGEKEMTGYHLAMFSFVFLIFHLPIFWVYSWSLKEELDIISIFFIFIVIWDYLWFVVNPHFTIKNFKGDHIFWHRKWIGKWPSDYWFASLVSFLIAVIIDLFLNEGYLVKWLLMFVIFLSLTFLTKILIKKFKPEWE